MSQRAVSGDQVHWLAAASVAAGVADVIACGASRTTRPTSAAWHRRSSLSGVPRRSYAAG